MVWWYSLFSSSLWTSRLRCFIEYLEQSSHQTLTIQEWISLCCTLLLHLKMQLESLLIQTYRFGQIKMEPGQWKLVFGSFGFSINSCLLFSWPISWSQLLELHMKVFQARTWSFNTNKNASLTKKLKKLFMHSKNWSSGRICHLKNWV